jgi:hypothetical protein
MLANAAECADHVRGLPELEDSDMKRVIFGLRVAVVCAFAMASASCGDNTGNASCGNGILEPGEECDTSIPQGHNGACPDVSACNDQNPCTEDTVVGGGTCQAKCSHKTITQVIPNDGCCVSGDPMLEPECMGCGDGVVDPAHGEICDTGIAAGMPGHCPTAADCPSTQCKQLMGSACTAQCVNITTPSGTTMDGCCPPGANNDPADTTHFDSDCNSNCGNGILENGEQCDTGIAAGQAGACPQNIADCGAAQVCVRQTIQGTNCQAHCVATTITTCSANTADNCCPSGCMRSTDIDCPATCGDGVVESNETCDPSASGSVCQTAADCAAIVAADTSGCTHSTLTGSAANCTAQCSTTHTTTTSSTSDGCCPPGGNANNDPDCSAICGNGVVESGELCDTAIPSNISGHCPSTSECTAMSNGTCPSVTRTGSGCTEQCSATYPAANATTRDSCCPPGNNNNTDIDCSAVCGNGVVETRAGELCDTGISSGTGKCPTNATTDCNDSIACTTDTISGSGCTAQCVHTAITACINNDGCCAPGCINANDNDCPPGCGDGNFPATGKTCDPCRIPTGGTCPASCGTCVMNATTGVCPTASQCRAMTTDPCNPFILTGSGCTAQCVQQAVTTATCGDGCCLRPTENISVCAADCPGAFCGDSIITSPETCDGTFVAGNAHFSIPAGGTSTGTTCAGSVTDCVSIRDNAGNTAAFPDGPSPSACYPQTLPNTNPGIVFSGSASGCSANCTFTEVAPSGNASDNCCPRGTGATGGTNIATGADIDCAVCGDGTIDLGEACDGVFSATNAHYTHLDGTTSTGTTCATSAANCTAIVAANSTEFPDGPNCYPPAFSGNGCNTNCSFTELAPSGSVSDGCCPANRATNPGNEQNDIDCPTDNTTCGNGLWAIGSLAAATGDSPCSVDGDCLAGEFCIASHCKRERCDTAISPFAPGHCPTAMECRGQTSSACQPTVRTGSACNAHCIAGNNVMLPGQTEQTCVTGAPRSVDPACGTGGTHPPCCSPPTACNPTAVLPNASPPTNCGGLGQPSCCGHAISSLLPFCCSELPDPVCCVGSAANGSGSDGCCPPPITSVLPLGGLDSFLFDSGCVNPIGAIPTNCGTSTTPRCCSPGSNKGGDQDCYCGDGNPPPNPTAPLHGESCEDPLVSGVSNHNNFDGCTDSCTIGSAAGFRIGLPCVGVPNGGGPGGGLGGDVTYCDSANTLMVCGTERIDPRFNGGYCSIGGLAPASCGDGTAANPCGSQAANSTCVSGATGGFACIAKCGPIPGGGEYGCRYNEGYHCVPLPSGQQTPFCTTATGGTPNNGTTVAGCVNPNGNPPSNCSPTGAGGAPVCCRPQCVAYPTNNACKKPPEDLACQGSSPDPNCDPGCGFDGNDCCCVCQGCANICGDGTVQSATGETCDSGQNFINGASHNYPDNYNTGVAGCVAPVGNPPSNCAPQVADPACGTGGTHPPCCCQGCTTSCQLRLGWIGDPCHMGNEAVDCATLSALKPAGTVHCLTYDPNGSANPLVNDPKFRTRYDQYPSGDPGGFQNNGYCSAECSLTAQDCGTLQPFGAAGPTLQGACVPGEGQNPFPPSGKGVCVFGCISNTQCRFKEGYRCWPIANLFGLPSTFLSEGPRACINPGDSGPPCGGAGQQCCGGTTCTGGLTCSATKVCN